MADQENNISPDMNLSDFSKEQQENKGTEAPKEENKQEESHEKTESHELHGNPVMSPEHERDAINEVPVEITAVVGKRKMPVRELIKLGRGAVVTLDRKLGSPIDIYANDRLIARGEITIVEDDNIAVTMTEIMSANSGV